jgi:hypothetical protein
MTECWKCRNNKTNGEDTAKVKIVMKCRLSYTDGYMRTHQNVSGYKCSDFESKET